MATYRPRRHLGDRVLLANNPADTRVAIEGVTDGTITVISPTVAELLANLVPPQAG